MELTINGERHRFERVITVRDLIAVLRLEPRKVAIERNREIVPRSAYENTGLCDGDQLEIVHFVGGG
jgi:thiamine biosynthesis protein ThiS